MGGFCTCTLSTYHNALNSRFATYLIANLVSFDVAAEELGKLPSREVSRSDGDTHSKMLSWQSRVRSCCHPTMQGSAYCGKHGQGSGGGRLWGCRLPVATVRGPRMSRPPAFPRISLPVSKPRISLLTNLLTKEECKHLKRLVSAQTRPTTSL